MNHEDVMTVAGIKVWLGIFNDGKKWCVIGNVLSENGVIELYYASNSKIDCFEQAHSILRGCQFTLDKMKKNREWLTLLPTDKQVQIIESKLCKLFV